VSWRYRSRPDCAQYFSCCGEFDSSEQNGERSYRYQARFKSTTFIMHFVITDDDRISVMMPELNP
jgi:hypothetical protein